MDHRRLHGMRFERHKDPKKALDIGVSRNAEVVISLYAKHGGKITGRAAHDAFRKIERGMLAIRNYSVDLLDVTQYGNATSRLTDLIEIPGTLLRFGGRYYQMPL